MPAAAIEAGVFIHRRKTVTKTILERNKYIRDLQICTDPKGRFSEISLLLFSRRGNLQCRAIIIGLLNSFRPSVKPSVCSCIRCHDIIGGFTTGIGIYDELGRFAGMGAALPITGFANSIVSPAMEFKREGFVLGVSAKMFQVAGPVIVHASIISLVVSILKVFVFS